MRVISAALVKKDHLPADISGMQTSTRSPRRLLAVTTLVFVMGLVLAPTAHAQLDGATTTVGEAAGAVTDTTAGVTDTVEGDGQTSGSSDDPIKEATDTVNKTVGDTSNTVEKTSGEVKEVAGSTQETVNETADELGGNATGTVNKVAGQLVGSGGNGGRTTDSRTPGGSSAVGAEVLGLNYEDAFRGRQAGANGSLTSLTSGTGSIGEAGESIVSQIGRVAAELAQQVAFPLALVMLVGGFLMVQNRIDRKDPKLAVAPVDSERDLLSFT